MKEQRYIQLKKILLLGFLLLQIYIPLRYYLYDHSPLDERFAWRMLSATRMNKCYGKILIDNRVISNRDRRITDYVSIDKIHYLNNLRPNLNLAKRLLLSVCESKFLSSHTLTYQIRCKNNITKEGETIQRVICKG